jgi:hypothetical protein
MRASVPDIFAGQADTLQVTVVGPDGSASNALPFALAAASSAQITPASGPSGTIITIAGAGFAAGSVVWFEGSDRSGSDQAPILLSSTQLRASVPDVFAGLADTLQVTVVRPDGTASDPLAFTLTAASSGPLTLCTLDDLKVFLGLADSDTVNAPQLNRYIRIASNQILGYCKQDFQIVAIENELHDGDDTHLLSLDHTPIQSIEALSIDGQTIDPTEVKVYPAYIKLDETFTYDARLRGFDRVFGRGTQNIAVSYQAGFLEVPPEIEEACLLQVVFLQNLANRQGIVTETNQVAGSTTSYAQTQLAPSVRVICNRFRRKRLAIV